ncbi:MAG: glycosyltransferase family 4 protein [Planctomycetales bacterium]|nr:glycosyltransferase family 4 protein [Planctomycetales bacterium]
MMRIAYICADPGVPVFGSKGCSIHVQEIVRAMSDRGATVEIFAARTGGAAPHDLTDCLVHELPLAKTNDTKSREMEQIRWNQRVVNALNARGRFDLLYERHALWSCDAMCWAKQHGVPSVLEVNSPLVDEQAGHRELVQKDLARTLTRKAMRNASMTYVVSDSIVGYCGQFLSADQTVQVIANGVNLDRFSPAVKSADPFDGITFGFIGSLKPWHGVEELIDGYARFCAAKSTSITLKSLKSRLVIVGDGPQRVAIERQSRQLGVESHIKFVGSVAPDSVPNWLTAIDIAIAPYPDLDHFYFSPLKLFEYMAAGRVTLASAIGQIQNVVQHDVNGWLYPPGEVDKLAEAMFLLCSQKTTRERLGAAARKTAAAHSWRGVLDQIMAHATGPLGLVTNLQGARDEIAI